MSPPRDTIYALSSGRIPAAIAVVRISGPRAGDALKALAGKIPEPRKAAFARVRDPQTQEPIDDALALWFPGPNSETGEDTAELQLHGGRAVLAATLAALGRLDGFRPAEAGEFTRRAFENGKLDLTAVEGLADLVAAETQAQSRQALRQMQGALRAKADRWRERLIEALALTEAGIDFSDEGDVPDDLTAPARAIARELAADIAAVLRDAARGERLRDGFVVAIAGPPNAGKSTLLNRLAEREVAIVSEQPGTTRDVIEVHLDLGGWPVTLLDTAGIRETADPVEMEGVRRARERAAAADLVLWVVDATGPLAEAGVGLGVGSGAGGETGSSERRGEHKPRSGAPGGAPAGPVGRREEVETDRMTIGAGAELGSDAHREKPVSRKGLGGPGAPIWLIRNKIDLLGPVGNTPEPANGSSGAKSPTAGSERPEAPRPGATVPQVNHYLFFVKNNERISHNFVLRFSISSTSASGLAGLVASITAAARQALGAAEPALVTRERQRLALQQAGTSLARAADGSVADDLLAEDLRLAARALGRLTGRVDVEHILQVIFRDFCIGK